MASILGHHHYNNPNKKNVILHDDVDAEDGDFSEDVTILGNLTVAGTSTLTAVVLPDTINVDVIDEKNAPNGVTVESVLIKDSDIVLNNTEIEDLTLGQTMKEQMTPGFVSGFGITDLGTGSVTIATGIVYLRDAVGPLNILGRYVIPEWVNEEVAVNTETYFYVDYNSGTPIMKKTLSGFTSCPCDKVDLYEITRNGTTDLHITPHHTYAVEAIALMQSRFYQTGIVRASGLLMSDLTSQNFDITAGIAWLKLNRIEYSAYDSSATQFTYFYRTGAVWTSALSNTWSNANYNNVASGLASLTTNKYTYIEVYVENDGDVVCTYGTSQHTAIVNAETAPRDSERPERIGSHGLYIGRLVFREGDTTITSVLSAFDTLFTSSAVTNHNTLSGLSSDDHPQYALLTGRSGDTLLIDDIDEFTTNDGVTIDSLKIENDGTTIDVTNTNSQPTRINTHSNGNGYVEFYNHYMLMKTTTGTCSMILDRPGTNFGILQYNSDGSQKWNVGLVSDATSDYVIETGGGSSKLEISQSTGIVSISDSLKIDAINENTNVGVTIEGVKFEDTKITLVNEIDEFSTDGTLGGDSDTAIPTEKAVKLYVDNLPTVSTHESTYNHGNYNDAYLHVTADGSSHSFINQSVATNATPTFNELVLDKNSSDLAMRVNTSHFSYYSQYQFSYNGGVQWMWRCGGSNPGKFYLTKGSGTDNVLGFDSAGTTFTVYRAMTVTGATGISGVLTVNEINEKSGGTGVKIESVELVDGNINAVGTILASGAYTISGATDALVNLDRFDADDDALIHFKTGTTTDWSLGTEQGGNSDFSLLGATAGEAMKVLLADNSVYFPDVFGDVIGGGSDVIMSADGNIGTVVSIRQAKINIKDLDNISWFYKLKPKSYNLRKVDKIVKNKKITRKYRKDFYRDVEYGMVYDEINTIKGAENLLSKDKYGKPASVYYRKLVPILVKVVQDQKKEIDALKSKYNDIIMRLNTLELYKQ